MSRTRGPLGPDARPDLRDTTHAELASFCAGSGEPPYRVRQVLRWVYGRGARSVAEMTDVPRAFRQALASQFRLRPLVRRCVVRGEDGTRKIVFGLVDGESVESVLIPDRGRLTLCLSSQVGCAMGCRFCATARMGLRRNLAAGEIVGQLLDARQLTGREERLTNLVFMGMGEPLANLRPVLRAVEILTAPWGCAISPRRVTVSTVGLVQHIRSLLGQTKVNLAVSLGATTDEARRRLIPAARGRPLASLLDACRALPLPRRSRITFAYVLLDGLNDSDADARRLVRLLRGLRAKVNLIPFNSFPGSDLRPSPRERLERFQQLLRAAGLQVTVRESRGRDIQAACGQLVAS